LYIFVIIYMTVMCTCTHVHDNVSCTRLQNYMIVYTNMVALTKLVLRNKKNLLQSITQREIFAN